MKVVFGAGKTAFDGWISTDENELNLLRREDFERFFGSEKASAMLAEHVFEHLTAEEGLIAAKNCYDFLEEGGYFRVAVPDGFFRNEWYQNMVKPGGNGDPSHPAFTHKIVYNINSLTALFKSAGFVAQPLEYCDESGRFHYTYWNDADGHIGRSYRFDTRNSREKLGMVSVIIDAKKPLIIG